MKSRTKPALVCVFARSAAANWGAIQTTKQQTTASPVFVEAEKLFEQMKEFSQSVARRAYEYFEARGREFGHDLEDWFRAESELMRRVPVEIKEADSQITVRAEVPGFAANEINVSVEPQRWSSAASRRKRRKIRRSRPCSPRSARTSSAAS